MIFSFLKNLVGAFVDVHHQSMARMRTLEEETSSLKQHVNSLKRELSDAVHREFNEHVSIESMLSLFNSGTNKKFMNQVQYVVFNI